MSKNFEYVEYNGWSAGFPSWALFTWLSSYYDDWRVVESLFDGDAFEDSVVEFRGLVEGNVRTFVKGEDFSLQASLHGWVVDNLHYLARAANWTQVHDALREERTLQGGADEVTKAAYDLLLQVDWEDIAEQAESLTEADNLLRDWVSDQLTTWAESPDERRYNGALTSLAASYLDIAIAALDWESIAEDFRSE